MPDSLPPPNSAVTDFMDTVTNLILNPLIMLLFALAMMYFLWGVFKFIQGQDNEEAQEEGKSHMMWGIAGMAIMFAVYGILNIIGSTAGQIGG
ncbi:MAG: hypothetical protein UY07_C0035G0009 [Parcubacteria group bacterium GW2011_GWA1_47_8]|nr:MAG: hypothetical protein UY07_C0035G0009 [Parcubacteria group bacterium GW2011_GWA1_47_8]